MQIVPAVLWIIARVTSHKGRMLKVESDLRAFHHVIEHWLIGLYFSAHATWRMACVHSMLHAHGVTDTAAQQRTRRRHAVTVLAQTRGRLGPPATQPPLAPKAPKEFVLHGDSQIDEFAWLRDPSRRQPHVSYFLYMIARWMHAMLALSCMLCATNSRGIHLRLTNTTSNTTPATWLGVHR